MDHNVTFWEAFKVWCKVALLSFGGPAGQIAVMHRILVEEKRWVEEHRFLHALNYCMLLPGPEAQQLATYIGWLLHRTRGGIVAGTLFVLPGFISILILSILYASYREITWIESIFFGLKPAVLAIVVSAVIRIGKRTLKNSVMVSISAGAFIGIFFFNVPFPVIVVLAGLVGFVGGKWGSEKFHVLNTHEGKEEKTGPPPVLSDQSYAHTDPSLSHALKVLAICLTLWFGPLTVLVHQFGWTNVYVQEGLFFSKAAVVTFGGAYAVLAYMAQQAVYVYGWLQPGEMLDGLGMAETTPGPLIMVAEFVGYLGAFRDPGPLHPVIAGTLGAFWVTWVTFVPCFLWIFLGAPFIEQLRGNRSLNAALSGITAAVVGVVLNLAVWFALHTVFGEVDEIHRLGMRLFLPEWGTVSGPSFVLAVGAFLALLRFNLGMMKTLGGSVLFGSLYFLLIRGG
jgi:chromate transporter